MPAAKVNQNVLAMTRQSIRLHRCFSLPRARLGWLLLTVGAISWQMFGRHADWPSLLFLTQELTQTNGMVRDVNGIDFTVGDESNNTPIYAVSFEFADTTGFKWRGCSWTENDAPKLGEQVTVEFATKNPGMNRIVNLRSAPLPLWAGAVLLFPIFGLTSVLRAVLFDDDRSIKCQDVSKLSSARKTLVEQEYD